MFFHRSSQHRTKYRGQAMVEMALVVTVLLFLSMGLIQFALIANARITLTNLAREGARFAAVHATETGSDNNADSTKGIKTYVVRVADSTSLNSIAIGDITISPMETSPMSMSRSSGKPITVTVNYNMRNKFILPVSFPGLSRFGTNTSSSAKMIIE